MKTYIDERINELIKKSFEIAVKDEEWKYRTLDEWNILFEDIDNILMYIRSGRKGDIYVNSNMWWVLQDVLYGVMKLYGLRIDWGKAQEKAPLIDDTKRKCYIIDEDLNIGIVSNKELLNGVKCDTIKEIIANEDEKEMLYELLSQMGLNKKYEIIEKR